MCTCARVGAWSGGFNRDFVAVFSGDSVGLVAENFAKTICYNLKCITILNFFKHS